MLTQRAILTALHGMCFGGLALLTAFGVVVGMCMVLSADWAERRLLQPAGWGERLYLLATAVCSWAAVWTGTFLVYPWYRAKPPAGTADLHVYPRALLLSATSTAPWHTVGMEWKEHVAFLAPVVVTAVVVIWWRYREVIARDRATRAAVVLFGAVGVGAAAVAAVLGAFLNKLAPTY